jgi:hypothetical protein
MERHQISVSMHHMYEIDSILGQGATAEAARRHRNPVYGEAKALSHKYMQGLLVEFLVWKKSGAAFSAQLYKSCGHTKQQKRVTNPARVHSARDKILVSEQTNNVRDETMCTTTVCAPRNKDTRIPRGLQHRFIQLRLP